MPVQNNRRWRCSKCHIIHETSNQINDCPQNKHTYHGCTNSGHQVAVAIKFCTMKPNFVDSQYCTCLMSQFWCLGFWASSKNFGKFVHSWPTHYVFVEDDAFALTPHPMKSYPRTYKEKRKVFNYRFSRSSRTDGKYLPLCFWYSGNIRYLNQIWFQTSP